MPQSERSNTIKELLKWLNAKSKKEGATLKEIIHHVTLEITELGATDRTIRGYIRTLLRTGMIKPKGTKFICTDKCKNWLERKF